MSVVVFNRRQFLVGAGGATLALPMLTSLLPATARAQAAQPRPRFVAIASSHGCVKAQNMCPDERTLADRQRLFDNHEVRRGALALRVDGNRAQLSPVLSGPSQRLTPQLASKMNVIRGLDVSWYLGHHTGGHLGNFARNDVGKLQESACPTIDQLMAYSPAFYPDVGSIKKRSMHVGVDGNLSVSWGYSNPSAGAGDIQAVPSSYSSKDLFDSIFVRQATPQQSARKPVVDQVFASYKSLRDGASGDAKRLSANDRRRLEEHMGRIAELQQRVNVVAQCRNDAPARNVDKSSGGLREMVVRQDQTREFYQTFNDVIVAAFSCGTSRIATIHPYAFVPYAGDYHQEIAHTAYTNEETQNTLMRENQKLFEELYLDLIAKLDVDEGGGKTILDNTLVMWTQESGPSTHDPLDMPVVTAGSAAGFLRTGNYVDYRNMQGPSTTGTNFKTGILYNQWLGTVLQAMGVPPSGFERGGNRGYGGYSADTMYGDPNTLWPNRLRERASDVVPFLKA